jgi:hypothetical protein
MTGVLVRASPQPPTEKAHGPDDLRVPEVLGDVASGVDLVTVALQARDPAGVVPLLGYEVQYHAGITRVSRGPQEPDSKTPRPRDLQEYRGETVSEGPRATYAHDQGRGT